MIKEDLKIGCVCPVYNRDKYIGPYLEMMEDFGVTCAVTLGNKPWSSQGNEEIIEKDKTEKILDKYFPNMMVLKDDYAHHKDSLNAGIEKLQECDIIVVNDCDMFITKEDWNECLDFICEKNNWNNYSVFALNFEKMINEYFFNHYYGKLASPGGAPPIMVIKPHVRMKSMIQTSGDSILVWDVDAPKYHHMRYCKPNGSGKHKYKEPTSVTHNMNDFTPAPKEIINRIEKWEKIIKKL